MPRRSTVRAVTTIGIDMEVVIIAPQTPPRKGRVPDGGMGDQLLRCEGADKRRSRGFARSRQGQNARNVGCSG
jgi:hypothetical protein